MRLSRANKDLYDPIEQLEEKYNQAGKDFKIAWESLTSDEISFIIREAARCLKDPIYYLENYHFIRRKDLIISTIYPLFDAQRLFLDEFMRQFNLNLAIRILVLKARQMGITTISVAMMCWLVFSHPLCHAISMSDELDKVIINFDMARTAYKFLPWWLKPEKRYDQRPILLGFDRLKQEDREDSAGLEAQLYFESANQPAGAAYSKSLYGSHLAEIGRYRNAKPITEGVFGSLVGFPHSIGIFEGTAQGRHTTFHKLWKKAEQGKFWTPVFMEWFREQGYTMVVPQNFQRTPEENAIAKKIAKECKYRLTDGQFAWRRAKIEEFEAAGEEETFPQEFPLTPEEAFISTGLTAFPKTRLHTMSIEFGEDPRWVGEIRLDFKDNRTPILYPYIDGRLWCWEFPQPNATYQVGADCALGIDGADYSCAQVYCVPDDITKPIRQVARWRGYMPPTEFARVLTAIGYFYNGAELAPECNKIDSVASDCAKVLMYPRIYRWIREDKIKNIQSVYIGWLTQHKNKNGLIGRMRDALLGWTIVIRCIEDIDEMYDFVETEPGSNIFGALPGSHDDSVMSTLITYYTATQLRPRWAVDETMTEKPKGDFQSSDYSPIWDKEDQINDSKVGEPSFMEL